SVTARIGYPQCRARNAAGQPILRNRPLQAIRYSPLQHGTDLQSCSRHRGVTIDAAPSRQAGPSLNVASPVPRTGPPFRTTRRRPPSTGAPPHCAAALMSDSVFDGSYGRLYEQPTGGTGRMVAGDAQRVAHRGGAPVLAAWLREAPA